jgi:hypothetical protein
MSYLFLCKESGGRVIWLNHHETLILGEGLKEIWIKNFVIFGSDIRFNNLRLSFAQYANRNNAKTVETI